ncbi:NF-X1-type zinc finger protein NFXL1 [Galendromus occidentalis]|uniref:NF-X1-type zinc finger protein NFXL1 n=1 Tax=Galendromus occidentalis TaxID=34638 RepID=A0AAJ6QM68_9ACAR|nr:NF-X1-type zinc finger protein NFXL1 [Galendromus occidentalis]
MVRKKKVQTAPLVNSQGRESSPAQGQNATFQAACAKIRENTQRHLEKMKGVAGDDEEAAEDEVPLEEESILKKISEGFSGNRQDTQNILDNLLSGIVTCLICIESVRHTEATWSCPHCFQILHLTCVGKWAKDSLFLFGKSGDGSTAATTWSCPNCRSQLTSIPQQYMCFCGKEKDPNFDKWLCPHSCGSICARALKPACGHTCTLLCHPGPCPPCPKTVQAVCFCNASTVTRRCSQKEWSCNGVCRRPLACGLHACPELCHRGECSPCKEQSIRKCNCGSSERRAECAALPWKCEKLCGKQLSCGLHRCEDRCHRPNECGVCPGSRPRCCPCGRTKYTELSCTQTAVPTCLNTCEKLLSCGEHRCWNKCHEGDCENCLEMVLKACRCGAKSRQMQCQKAFTCDKKCGRSKPCGHICTRKCCPPDEDCPPCTIACNKKLHCGIHKCQSLCHSGPCFPCRDQKEKACPCGKTSLLFPCGTNLQTAKVVCRELCVMPPDCHHETKVQHRCHPGRCPPCALPCARTLSCGHTCTAKCHSAVLAKILPKEKPRGPWEPQPQARWELIAKPCPPCNELVRVDCFGKHGETEWPCHAARISSCGKPCGRILPCGQHGCTLECHVVSDAPNGLVSGSSCEQYCGNGCQSKSRPEECSHPCGRPCHAGDCSPCNQYVQFRCHCENTLTVKSCREWCAMTEEERRSAQRCLQRCGKNLECGHRCFLKCHPGECGDPRQCRKMITLFCSCRRIKQEVCCGARDAKSQKVKCDEECRAIQQRLKRQEDERRAFEEAAKKKQEEERNALEVERVLGGRRTKRGKKKDSNDGTDCTAGFKFDGVALTVAATTVLILVGAAFKVWFDT